MSLKPLNFHLFAKFEKAETQTNYVPAKHFFHFLSPNGPFAVQVTEEQFAAPPTSGSDVWIEGVILTDIDRRKIIRGLYLRLNKIFHANEEFPAPALEEQEQGGYFDGVCTIKTKPYTTKWGERRYQIELGGLGLLYGFSIDKPGIYADVPKNGFPVFIKGRVKMFKENDWKFCYPRLHPTDFEPLPLQRKPSAESIR